MKNPLSHLNIEAPFSILRSVLFHFSKKIDRISVDNKYLGLCAYIHGFSNIDLSKDSKIYFKNNGFLVFGTENSSFKGWAGRTKMYFGARAEMHIHGYNQIGRGSLVWLLDGGRLELHGGVSTSGKNMIISKERITIGQDVQIAWGVTISDHDFHKLYENGVQRTETSPVIIENNVWIGMNSTVLKGVTIGEGAVIAAGSLVTKNIPPRCLAAGVPAKVIRENVEFYG
jgi:acetyltransferase-like isoleucine patch superfamily enzyme